MGTRHEVACLLEFLPEAHPRTCDRSSVPTTPTLADDLFEAHRLYAEGRSRDAAFRAGAVIEESLRQVAVEIEGSLSHEQVRRAHALVPKNQGDKEITKWTFKTLVLALKDEKSPLRDGLLRSKFAVIGRTLNALNEAADIRNDATHQSGTRLEAEANFCLMQAEWLLRTTGVLGPSPTVVDGLAEAESLLRRAVRLALGVSDEIRIQWLGLTLERAAPMIRAAFLESGLHRELGTKPLSFEVLMMDPDWTELDQLFPRWSTSAQRGLQSLAAMTAEHSLRVVAHAYRSMPRMHGFRINGMHVVASSFRRLPGLVAPSTAPYFGVSSLGTPAERFLASEFEFFWSTMERGRELINTTKESG